MTEPLLQIVDLSLRFRTPRGVAQVISNVNLRIQTGEFHGLVGESGSGKSVTAHTILALHPPRLIESRSGQILFEGSDILQMSEPELRRSVRGTAIAMIFQDPMTSLCPTMTIGRQLMTPLRQHLGLSRAEARRRSLELLDSVRIPDAASRFRSYPHELSGGQRQRVMIAIALSCQPKLLLADEPTTALDVTVQARIMDLLQELRGELNFAMLLISHDLALIAERCSSVSVMYGGRIIEEGTAEEIFETPTHPYTAMLENARPRIENEPHQYLPVIPGQAPNLLERPTGCSFAPRCSFAQARCTDGIPPAFWRSDRHFACCHYPLSEAGMPADAAVLRAARPDDGPTAVEELLPR